MLVLANGAFKSGSSWLRAILAEMMPFEDVPESYRSGRHDQPWLDPTRMRAFLSSGDYLLGTYLSKSHVYGQRSRSLLLSHPNVLVFDIERDLRDAIVSHYYHFRRAYAVPWSFDRFYWRVGRFKAFQIRQYHLTWRAPHPQLYTSSYERLKTDFDAEARRLAAHLGLEPSEADLARIRDGTSIDTMRRVRNQDKLPPEQRFFRKGAVGDWHEHFDERALADIDRIAAAGLPALDRLAYHLLFDLRPRVQSALPRRFHPSTS